VKRLRLRGLPPLANALEFEWSWSERAGQRRGDLIDAESIA
jgi:hypothetical protein